MNPLTQFDTESQSSPSRRTKADRRRADSASKKILDMLLAAGERGCLNTELWTICHAVNSRVADLRARGFKIEAMREGAGVWRYRLAASTRRPEPETAYTQRSRALRDRAMPLFASGTGARP